MASVCQINLCAEEAEVIVVKSQIWNIRDRGIISADMLFVGGYL